MIRAYMTGVEAVPVNVPGKPDEEQPGICLVIHSGDLLINTLMPAAYVEDVCEVMLRASAVATGEGNGLVIPSVADIHKFKPDERP